MDKFLKKKNVTIDNILKYIIVYHIYWSRFGIYDLKFSCNRNIQPSQIIILWIGGLQLSNPSLSKAPMKSRFYRGGEGRIGYIRNGMLLRIPQRGGGFLNNILGPLHDSENTDVKFEIPSNWKEKEKGGGGECS